MHVNQTFIYEQFSNLVASYYITYKITCSLDCFYYDLGKLNLRYIIPYKLKIFQLLYMVLPMLYSVRNIRGL